jgi:hypothetical protein
MKLISHRGNTNGRFEDQENEPKYIDLALSKGYDVEVDVRYNDNILWLGHDNPKYLVDFKWFLDRITKLWIHCKNPEAIVFFQNSNHNFNFFWHQNDDLTLTSNNFIWVYPGKQPIMNSIAVMPEIYDDDLSKCFGICSDYIDKYKF